MKRRMIYILYIIFSIVSSKHSIYIFTLKSSLIKTNNCVIKFEWGIKNEIVYYNFLLPYMKRLTGLILYILLIASGLSNWNVKAQSSPRPTSPPGTNSLVFNSSSDEYYFQFNSETHL